MESGEGFAAGCVLEHTLSCLGQQHVRGQGDLVIVLYESEQHITWHGLALRRSGVGGAVTYENAKVVELDILEARCQCNSLLMGRFHTPIVRYRPDQMPNSRPMLAHVAVTPPVRKFGSAVQSPLPVITTPVHSEITILSV